MLKGMLVFALVLLAIACNNSVRNDAGEKTHDHDSAAMLSKPTDSLPVFTAAMLDSKKDLVCGMPVSAGVSDTAHYKGKVYGFCAKECKDDFLKNPGQYLSAK